MYSSLDSGSASPPSGLKRLARRDLPSTPRTPRPTPAPAAQPAVPDVAWQWPEVTVGTALVWVRQRLLWIVVLAVTGLTLGYGYSLVATPRFTAYTDLVVDPADLQVINNDLYRSSTDQNSQLLDVESKLRVLTSGNVLTRVVTELELQNDPEFSGAGSAPLGLSFLGGAADVSGDPVLNAVGALEKKVSARREERSYVVTLSVTTENPNKSVRIADAVVAAFQTELAKAETEGAARTADALIDRLAELKTGVTAAEQAVQEFRRAHGLEETGAGELVNEQSLSLLNQRQVEAKQALIAIEARYAELTDATTGKLNADAIQTPTMVALRTQYGLIRQQADANATLYGPLHPNRASGDRQISGLQAQIDAEAQRYVQSMRLELDQARSTVAQVEAQLAAVRGTVASDGDAQVALRDLERDAKAKSDVYESFLTRAREVTERQQIDTSNIRVISPATPPSSRSWPPRGYVVAGGGAFAGLAAGIGLALGLGFLAASRKQRKA